MSAQGLVWLVLVTARGPHVPLVRLPPADGSPPGAYYLGTLPPCCNGASGHAGLVPHPGHATRFACRRDAEKAAATLTGRVGVAAVKLGLLEALP